MKFKINDIVLIKDSSIRGRIEGYDFTYKSYIIIIIDDTEELTNAKLFMNEAGLELCPTNEFKKQLSKLLE